MRTGSVPTPGSGAPLRRVGHKGAGLIAPGNTFAAFDAARATGVDMIEFDVVPEPPAERMTVRAAEQAGLRGRWETSELLLAHDWADTRGRVPHTLQEGLDHLARPEFAGIELDVDLKLPGYERQVLDALRAHDLLDRALISSSYRASLMRLRELERRARVGWSVPLVRRDPFRRRATLPVVFAGLQAARLTMPTRAAAALRGGACDAIMAHWRLVTPRLVRAVRDANGELYVWTVDELGLIRRLEAMGVHGVISNDPRLFAELEPV